ncbi:MAG TPA: D-alanyl-D-alanine carboxypeptidase family protein [Xanthobacteraceae bacterium]|jgi:D-alanyl-D-alanine carboxypeptidase (penicillin-binding protein 5/6)|nr:MAG: D-alanyl-D-alanine carboxypeptidase [Rhizobiales bacterium 35-66-30]OZA97354.1 MAG: D-alanyl-D-alanine carboxypeptidase [Rhizobiales bacterium 39-66-18]HQS08666.1 D-alanyl-D-alanine carboxypeptidase family protein [Xanthobacteraceae bacterium]
MALGDNFGGRDRRILTRAIGTLAHLSRSLTSIASKPAALAAGFAILGAATSVGPVHAQSTFQTVVPSAILVDFSTGAILFDKDSEKRVAPGGIVKIMTGAIVFDEIRSGRITQDTLFTVSENAWRRGGGPSGGAAMFAAVKSNVRVGDLLIGALAISGNDAAIALAEGVAGTEGEFTVKMNAKAEELGLTGTSFRNSTGFSDPGQVTTARDMAQLSRYIIRTFPNLYPIFAVPGIEWSKIKQRNRNPLLDAGVGADGLHASWVKDVGYHLVGSAVQNNQRLIAVVMGASSEKVRLEEMRRLLDWGFHSFEHRALFAADAELARAAVFGGETGSVGLAAREPISLLMPRNSQDKLVARITYHGPLRAPVAKGTEVAQMEITRGQLKVLDVPLVTTADVPVGTMWQRAFDGAGVLVGDTARDLGAKLLAKIQK